MLISEKKLFFLEIRMVGSCVGGSSFCLVAKASVHAAIPSSWVILTSNNNTTVNITCMCNTCIDDYLLYAGVQYQHSHLHVQHSRDE